MKTVMRRFPFSIKRTLGLYGLTLKTLRKKMHLKMSSAEVVCCKYLHNITDKLSIEANSMDPEHTVSLGAA